MHCCKQINSYIFFKKVLTSAKLLCIINLAFADVAHPVERNLAKVEVASSSLVIRSKTKSTISMVLFVFYKKRGSKRAIRQDRNSPVDCCGARVRAEESFSFQWASLSFCAKKEVSFSIPLFWCKEQRVEQGNFVKRNFVFEWIFSKFILNTTFLFPLHKKLTLFVGVFDFASGCEQNWW